MTVTVPHRNLFELNKRGVNKFIFQVRGGFVTMGILTSGNGPEMAAILTDEVESLLG